MSCINWFRDDPLSRSNPALAIFDTPPPRRSKAERRKDKHRSRRCDATLVSVLAYAGLRPGEALALRWGDVRERTILVQRASDGYGGVKTTKTRSVRTVRLLAPLAADLRAWRLASGRPDDGALVFPGIDERTVTREAWKSWTRRTWAEAWKAANTGRVERTPRVYDLRHSFVSLLLAEGRAIHYVAAQAGHDAQLTLSTYGHLLAEYADAGQINAESEINLARTGRQRQNGMSSSAVSAGTAGSPRTC